jgi:DNA-binding transcriptional regulator YiaG
VITIIVILNVKRLFALSVTKIVRLDDFLKHPYLSNMIMPEQCRAARGLLDWSQQVLADKANVGLSTVRNFEKGRSTPIANNVTAIRAAIEATGIEFVEGGVINPARAREMRAGDPLSVFVPTDGGPDD